MRIAAIYDIHANLPALQAVIQEIHQAGVELVIVGGDVVAGPLPNETLDLLRDMELPCRFILGNAESDVLRYLAGKEINGMSARADEEARWVASVLRDEHKAFLSGWLESITLNTPQWGDVLFCHATPHSDVEIFTHQTTEQKLLPVFNKLTAAIVVCGHTHIHFDRRIGKVRVVNAGSVGMPFGRTGVDWLLLDTEIHFKHTDFDRHDAAERIRHSNYPHAESFAVNHVLGAPSEADMLAMLKRLEPTSLSTGQLAVNSN